MQHANIKQVRKSLQGWGLFWARQEMGSGYASKSSTAKICEMLRTEIFVSSDLHLFSHLSENMHEPEHIKEISNAIAKLSRRCRLAVSQKYIKGRKEDDYYTREAENILMGLM